MGGTHKQSKIQTKMQTTKTFLDLSIDEKMEFFNLHNAYKSADKQEDRAKTSWKFLCFVYKHLGSDLLDYFIGTMYDGDDAKRIIASMIKMRAFIQPNLD
jgi:hypothetical protein